MLGGVVGLNVGAAFFFAMLAVPAVETMWVAPVVYAVGCLVLTVVGVRRGCLSAWWLVPPLVILGGLGVFRVISELPVVGP